MGRGAAIFKRKGGNVWRLLCGRDAVPGGNCSPAASGRYLPRGDGVELSRWLDLSRWCVRAVVQRIMDYRTGEKYSAAPRGGERRRAGLDANSAAHVVS